jgi:hypothetical protein
MADMHISSPNSCAITLAGSLKFILPHNHMLYDDELNIYVQAGIL